MGIAGVLADARLYQPVDHGEQRQLIIPVRVADPGSPFWPDPEQVVYHGNTVDLVAGPPHAPFAWSLRTRAAMWLGSVEPQCVAPKPVLGHPDPPSWLHSGWRGRW